MATTSTSTAPNPYLQGAGLVMKMGNNAASASAQNRQQQIDAAFDQEQARQAQQKQFEDQLLAREEENRAGSTDTWKKMQQAAYLENASGYVPPTMTSGRRLSDFGFGPKAATLDEIAGAKAVKDQSRDRLMSGYYNARGGAPLPQLASPVPFTVDPKLLKRGLWEKIGSAL